MPAVRAVLHPVHGPGLDHALCRVTGLHLETPPDTEQTLDALQDGAEVLITFDWDDRFLMAPGLRWVQAISVGVEQFPLDRLRDREVVLTSARGAHSPAVAEHTVALLLALVRGVGRAVRRSVRHEWRPEMASEVGGMTAAVLGLGSIGSEVIWRLNALGMRVIGIRRSPGRPPNGVEVMVGPDRLLWALQQVDVLICTLPGGAETEGLIGREELEMLGAAWFINVGRGQVVDEAALVDALTEGELRGAGLDVLATEPLPAGSPLWDLDDVIVTPHMAWASDLLTPRLVGVIGKNLTAYQEGGTWVNRVV